jgi:hypothetical protein
MYVHSFSFHQTSSSIYDESVETSIAQLIVMMYSAAMAIHVFTHSALLLGKAVFRSTRLNGKF